MFLFFCILVGCFLFGGGGEGGRVDTLFFFIYYKLFLIFLLIYLTKFDIINYTYFFFNITGSDPKEV